MENSELKRSNVATRTVSVPEAAQILGISRAQAYALAKTQQLPGAIRLGGRVVVSRAALLRALGEPAEV